MTSDLYVSIVNLYIQKTQLWVMGLIVLPSNTPQTDSNLDSATFEEWNSTVKLITINGETTFEGQFEGGLGAKLLHALFQTLSATQKGLCASATGRVDRARRKPGPRGKFTAEDDYFLIELKEDLNIRWLDINGQFSDRFPGRSKGASQVRYCTKLEGRQKCQ